ncbi:type II toxin-antitoxin system PemK/MazF family toxin [Pediococcus argentinicus]|uniref:type II toxin-antitoxin system PemK/MazF family toxin n=1 Tax=Pediococcus argentinicus TaxID=480391 RepID=UPI00338F4277
MVMIPKTGNIIYIDFNPSIGSEIQKRRPAVVISNNTLMQTSPFVWVVPISHGHFDGDNYPLHVILDEQTSIEGTIYTEQIKAFDYRNRHWQYVEDLPKNLLDELRMKVMLTVQAN